MNGYISSPKSLFLTFLLPFDRSSLSLTINVANSASWVHYLVIVAVGSSTNAITLSLWLELVFVYVHTV